jgi:hypothetical protein
MKSLAFKPMTLQIVLPKKLNWLNMANYKGQTTNASLRPKGNRGQVLTYRFQCAKLCLPVPAPDIRRDAESAVMVSFKTVEQTVRSLFSNWQAQCKMSNLVPPYSLVQVPGAKNSVLQRSQIMVSRCTFVGIKTT